MTPEDVAAALVANGWAHRMPLHQTRCVRTIELRATRHDWGRMYVDRRGRISYGPTYGASREVAPAFRRSVIGDQ